jgi:hypothetical protein
MFDENNVRQEYRVRVPSLLREEIHSLLLQYLHAGTFFMLSGECEAISCARRPIAFDSEHVNSPFPLSTVHRTEGC